MSKKSKYFIPFSEIDDFTQDMYHDYTDEIIGKSNPLDGERNFILSVISTIFAPKIVG